MPTAAQTANTSAPQLGAQYRTFVWPEDVNGLLDTYKRLLLLGVTTTLAGWTDPDTGLPTGWTEITAITAWRHEFNWSSTGNSATWEATLSGHDYDEDLLRIGVAVVQWRRYWTPNGWLVWGAGWQPWERAFVGQFVSANDADTYKHGQAWQRKVRGVDSVLARFNAPRITAGAPDITTGSQVTVKGDDTLAMPELEKDSSEFIGGLADVQPTNICDGKSQTVFISQSTPGILEDLEPYGAKEDGYIRVTEVFFAPIAGFPLDQSWWFEVHNCKNRPVPVSIEAGRWYDGVNERYEYIQQPEGWKETLDPERFGIFCANRGVFETLTGGAAAAQWVIDMSQYDATFTLDPSDGYVSSEGCRGTIIWAPGGVTRRAGATWNGGAPNYDATDTFDSDLIPQYSGYSVRRKLNYYQGTPGGDATDFSLNMYPSPGDHSSALGGVALLVTLPENICLLANSIDVTSTAIQLDNYIAWGETGAGVVEGDIFTYTGRSAVLGLTGVTRDAPTAHFAGARVFPVISDAAQTGYPCTAIKLFRRKTPYLERFQLYWSYMAEPRMYQEDGWRGDYAEQWFDKGGCNQAEHVLYILPYDAWIPEHMPAGWVRSVLLVIDHMTDDGRAKLNELIVKPSQLQINVSGVPDMNATSATLALWLLETYLGLWATDFVDDSAGAFHALGNYALAVTPMSQVLEDLARKTGCYVEYNPNGIIYWRTDQRWPLTPWRVAALDFTAGMWRGELRFSDDAPVLNAVVLDAVALDTEEPRPVRAVYPPPMPPGTEPPLGAQAQELDGYVVASETDARLVAEREFKRLTNAGTLEFTATGVVDWLVPGMLISVSYDWGSGAAATRYYQVEQVAQQRALTQGQQAFTDTVTARRFS